MKTPSKLLKQGKIVVLPTDTIYGIHASAFNPEAVEKVYKIRERDKDKPFIILISDINDLKLFDINISNKETKMLNQLWPNPVSVLMPCNSERFKYLHRGTKELAFRIPKHIELRKLLKETGPLISTSVNKPGQKPAATVSEAKEIFRERIDYYVDVGELTSEPSTLVRFENEKLVVLREGKYKISGRGGQN